MQITIDIPKWLVGSLLVGWVGISHAQSVSCPAMRAGKRLTDAAFFEWKTSSKTRSDTTDRNPLMPDESRVDGEDWFQTWNVTHAIGSDGLQMVCKYQGLPAGLFIEVEAKVSVCTLTKHAGVVAVEYH